jgi:hypothetical protein
MPEDVNVSCGISSNASSIETRRFTNEVSLGLKSGPFRVHSCVEDWCCSSRGPRKRLLGAVPGDVHTSVSTQGKLPTSHRTGRDRATQVGVDLDGLGELSSVLKARVKQISVRRFSLEVEEVNAAVCVNGKLRLKAPGSWACSGTIRFVNA